MLKDACVARSYQRTLVRIFCLRVSWRVGAVAVGKGSAGVQRSTIGIYDGSIVDNTCRRLDSQRHSDSRSRRPPYSRLV